MYKVYCDTILLNPNMFSRSSLGYGSAVAISYKMNILLDKYLNPLRSFLVEFTNFDIIRLFL